MNATALLPHRLFDGAVLRDETAVVVAQGRIVDVCAADAVPAAVPVRPLAGLLAPGFIDVQVNGGGGVLFNDSPDVATLKTIAAAHQRLGTTSLLPTLISDSAPRMEAAAAAVRQALAEGMPGVRGIHFEGPFLRSERRGVHRADALRPPEEADLTLIADPGLGRVVVTLAPEQVPPGTIARLNAAGVRVCAGHTAASAEAVLAALDEGLAGYTHLFNAMPPLAGREPGAVGVALGDARGVCGIIVDGVHVHPMSLKAVLAARPSGTVMLVSDAMPPVGGDGAPFILDGQPIHVADGRCVTDDGTLAGAFLDMAQAVRNTVSLLDADIAEALAMATAVPAGFLGLDERIGRIVPGCEADMVLLDDGLQVRDVWVAGKPLAGSQVSS